MDTRAWRLQWPPGFSVFEVDSQQVLDFKHRILHIGDSSNITTTTQQQQQQEEEEEGGGASRTPVLSCERRVAVVADASKPEGMLVMCECTLTAMHSVHCGVQGIVQFK
jgi:hypothetical protein